MSKRISKRILVVEDQEDLRASLRDFLSASGYAVIEAPQLAAEVVALPKFSALCLSDLSICSNVLGGYSMTYRRIGVFSPLNSMPPKC